MGPVDSGVLDEIRVIRPQRGSHHLKHEFIGQVGQRCSEYRGSVGFELSLSPEKLGNIDVGESCFLC